LPASNIKNPYDVLPFDKQRQIIHEKVARNVVREVCSGGRNRPPEMGVKKPPVMPRSKPPRIPAALRSQRQGADKSEVQYQFYLEEVKSLNLMKQNL
jgi:hypothetical protein